MGLRKLPSYQENPKNRIFQFGKDWELCLENKLKCRDERLGKYYQSAPDGEGYSEVSLWIINQLCEEWPEWFQKTNVKNEKTFDLIAKHTGDLISVENLSLNVNASKFRFQNPVDLFDALAMQVPEDLVIQKCEKDFSKDYCAKIHLCHANGWSAEWAVSKDFNAIHARVPNINNIVRDTSKMLSAIVNSKTPLERIGAVNFRTSPQLNRHPEIPENERHIPFHHQNNPNLFLRFERQCVVGFPESCSFLFTIRTYMTQISPQMPQDKWTSFVNCLKSSSEGTNPHKFLQNNREELNKWVQI